MHPLLLIPFLAVVGAAAFGATAVARSSGRREAYATPAIFLCGGTWALLDLMSQMEPDAEAARPWVQLMYLPALLIGPCTIALVAQAFPVVAARLGPWIRFGTPVAALFGAVVPFWAELVVALEPAPWGGWRPIYGASAWVLTPLPTVLPIVAAWVGLRARWAGGRVRADLRARAILAGVVVCVLAAVSTEVVLPVLGIDVPRLGAITIVGGTAGMWLFVLHATDELAVSRHGLARAVLATLQDGVALLQIDGTVRSANARLGELAGRRRAELLGLPIESLVDVPFDELRRGLQDREALLLASDEKPVPISLSSSIARDRRGGPVGLVVVIHDLRDVDALRRQLLASGRLAAVGELAAGLAHEVNNPVAFIRADLNFLNGRLDELAGLAEPGAVELDLRTSRARVQRALASIERIAEVVGDVRGFAHVGEQSQGASDPAAALESALRLARLERADEIPVEVRVGIVSERVGAGQELKQVLLVLLRQLVAGTGAGGALTVELGVRDGALRFLLESDRLAASAADLSGHIEGAGSSDARGDLALAVAQELIAGMGGALAVRSLGGNGLRLELWIPLSSDETPAPGETWGEPIGEPVLRPPSPDPGPVGDARGPAG